MRRSTTKDELHGALIVTLFKLVFLLLGRLPYRAKGKRRSLATFRTLTYSQTEEQLSWLLQGYMQRHASEHGLGDFFDADYAFFTWARENKRQQSDRSAYVEWVRLNFPETLCKVHLSNRSPDGAQRNPGFSYATQQPRISLRFIRATAYRYHGG
jgi:hypothetical protein